MSKKQKKLELQIVSDLHAEFWEGKKIKFTKPVAPILLLLGDICCCGSAEDFELFKQCVNAVLPEYEKVIFVPGNHEYYYTPTKPEKVPYEATMQGIHAKLKAFAATTNKKFIVLINKTLSIPGYTLIGSTLWSHIPEKNQKFVEKNMNDYNYIYTWNEETKSAERLKASTIDALFNHNVAYIKRQMKKCQLEGQKAIVLTHHKPYLSPNYQADNTINPAYESDLQHLFIDPVVLWAYGHTHMADNKKIGEVVLYSNPKGYPREKTFFKSNDLVTI